MTDTLSPFEQRVADMLQAKVAQLPPVTLELDLEAAPMSPISPPDESRSRRSRVLVAVSIAIVLVLVAAGITAAVRSNDSGHPAGPTDPIVARLTLEARPTLSFQAQDFTTIAGRNEITVVGGGGTEGLVFDDPALSAFHPTVSGTSQVTTAVDLQAGRDYPIHSVIPGHTEAGVAATIHVLPAGAQGTPPLPASVLHEVSQSSLGAGGPAHGTAEYTIAGRNHANQLLSGDETPRDEQPVYVFVLRGTFVDKSSYGPPGAPDPHGTVMTLTISQGTSPGILDYGMQEQAPDLSKLGGAISTTF